MIHILKKAFFAVLIILSSFSVFAADFKNNPSYAKLSFGAQKFNNIHSYDYLEQSSDKHMNFNIEYGIGFNINDNSRAEILFEYLSVKFLENNQNKVLYKLIYNTKRIFINSGSLNLYRNFYKFNDESAIFLGIAAGYSQIKEDLCWQCYISRNHSTELQKGYLARKIYTNFCYSIQGGFDFKLSPVSVIEVVYKFKDYGTTSGKKMLKNYINEKHYIAHGIFLGYRYNL